VVRIASFFGFPSVRAQLIFAQSSSESIANKFIVLLSLERKNLAADRLSELLGDFVSRRHSPMANFI
jgi:hypothetical protein